MAGLCVCQVAAIKDDWNCKTQLLFFLLVHFQIKHESHLPAGLCQQVGVVPAALAEPAAEASEPAEVGYLIFSVSKMLRVSHAAHNLLDAVVILICAASKKHI